MMKLIDQPFLLEAAKSGQNVISILRDDTDVCVCVCATCILGESD